MEFNEDLELRIALDEYITSFLFYQQVANDKECTDEEVLESVLEFADEADRLLAFMEEHYADEAVVLPDMEVYFKDGVFQECTYRIYRAVLGSGQIPSGHDRNIQMLVYTGEVLKKHFMG